MALPACALLSRACLRVESATARTTALRRSAGAFTAPSSRPLRTSRPPRLVVQAAATPWRRRGIDGLLRGRGEATFDPLGFGNDWRRWRQSTQLAKEEQALDTLHMASGRGPSGLGSQSVNQIQNFFNSNLPERLLILFLLLLLSRVGVYIPLPGVDSKAFAESASQGGLLNYLDTLSGGGISKLGIFSLGIVPYINASIVLQLWQSVFPKLKKLVREEGEAGRRQFEQYQRYAALAFAITGAVGQAFFLRPYVPDFSLAWFAETVLTLTAGAMISMHIAELIGELKIGNGTSIVIFTNIVSSIPGGIGKTVTAGLNADNGALNVAAFLAAFLFITTGAVYVQLAERKIPVNYARGPNSGGLSRLSYFPLKVNSAGVMPIIFASSLITVPALLGRIDAFSGLRGLAVALYPGGGAYLVTNVALIAFFNYFYTFLQLDPDDVSDQLKKAGASFSGIRPGRSTAAYLTDRLSYLSFFGSIFLALLAATPSLVEATTGLTAFRGFGGTSLLICVGVATDVVQKIQAELVMEQYSTLQDDLQRRPTLPGLSQKPLPPAPSKPAPEEKKQQR
eukprot:jgi/Chlat1/3354/Chrsp23S03778